MLELSGLYFPELRIWKVGEDVYKRQAQKDGSYNRDGQDFCSQIVLEIFDTGTKVSTCIGVAFEVGKNDTDIRKYTFFSHSGKIPDVYKRQRFYFSVRNLKFKLIIKKSSLKVTLFGETIFVRFEKHSNS